MSEITKGALLHVGHHNYVFVNALVCVLDKTGASLRRYVSDMTEKGRVIDATKGRKTRSVIVLSSDHVVLSSLETQALRGRVEELT